MTKPNKKARRWAKRLPPATHAEWVRPGSDWDKVRRSQEKQAEAKAENTAEKRHQARSAKNHALLYKLRGERIYDECVQAVEQEDIETAREEIRRDLRR